MGTKKTIPDLQQMKREDRKISMLTAYDFPTARILDSCGIDILLVGDSVGTVLLGYSTTLPVTMHEMIHHTKAVVRGATDAIVVADMPFMSYQESVEVAKRNAGRFLQEAGAHAVKLEGGVRQAEVVRAIVNNDIPVMGHVGLTPQSIHRFGGYRIQGKETASGLAIIQDAKAVEEAGAFALVLEGIPRDLAQEITRSLAIPTIGIGAGPHCNGQVLVIHDLLGLSVDFKPKFVKRYAHLTEEVRKAVECFIGEVQRGEFPDDGHSFH
jgi:3-methyl-2-oxobutanoate hydroxymethyltransferase